MSYNPSNYTRCEKCKHIDRENEKCEITNDGWLVSDRAGTCHQFKGVESMKVKLVKPMIGLELWETYTVKDKSISYYIIKNDFGREMPFPKEAFRIISEDENKDETLEKNISRIDLVLKTDDFLEYDYKQDVIECRCPSEFGLKEYRNEQCNSIDDTCCSRCWNELATKEEVERLSNAHKKQGFEENVKKGAEMLVKCSMSSIDVKKGSNVNHPSHYNKGKFEVIDVIEDWNLGFNLGNTVKYIARCEYKENKKQDLEKAMWYLKRELDKLEKENN